MARVAFSQVEAGANQLPEGDVIEAIDFGYEAVSELIKAQQSILKEAGIEQVIPETPEQDKTLPVYLEKACSKSIGEVLGQFEQTKAERDEKLDAIRSTTAEKIQGLKDSDPVRVAVSANGKALPNNLPRGCAKSFLATPLGTPS